MKRNGLFVLTAMSCLLISSCSSVNEEPPSDVIHYGKTNSSHSIPLEDVMKNADDFWAMVSDSGKTRSSRNVRSIERLMNLTRSDNDSSLMEFYVVNYDNDGGFILLAADDRAIAPVYGFSEAGKLDISNIESNPGLSEYLEGIQLPPDADGLSIGDLGWEDTFKGRLQKTREPLATRAISVWDQIDPYNKFCFTKTGEKAVVGCVALAAGQVMAIMRWPNIWPVNGLTWGESYTFNWDLIQNGCAGSGWTDSIARLLEILGRSGNLDMEYDVEGSEGSGTQTSKCVTAFYNFGYEKPTYSGTVDISLIRSKLDEKQPVILSGRRSGAYSGHAWVVDGYYTLLAERPGMVPDVYPVKYYMHFIWGGYRGDGNGFYIYDENNKCFKKDVAYTGPNDPNPGLAGDHTGTGMVYDFVPRQTVIIK